MGEMKRQEAWEEQRRRDERFTSTLVIGACIIAAVRLARVESLSHPSPRLAIAISDSVSLAKQILKSVVGESR